MSSCIITLVLSFAMLSHLYRIHKNDSRTNKSLYFIYSLLRFTLSMLCSSLVRVDGRNYHPEATVQRTFPSAVRLAWRWVFIKHRSRTRVQTHTDRSSLLPGYRSVWDQATSPFYLVYLFTVLVHRAVKSANIHYGVHSSGNTSQSPARCWCCWPVYVLYFWGSRAALEVVSGL